MVSPRLHIGTVLTSPIRFLHACEAMPAGSSWCRRGRQDWSEAMDSMHEQDPPVSRITRRALVAGAAGGAIALFAGGIQPVTAAAATSLFRGPTGARTVALTIDCGSDRGNAESILDTLATNGVRCSFGMTGMWAQANPALVRRMVSEGHHLMNHTNTHPSFTGLSTPGTGILSYNQRTYQIESGEQIIRGIAGVSTKPWFRAPYGDIDNAA